jgi:ribosomal-protein-alanine N-acetyltransferase
LSIQALSDLSGMVLRPLQAQDLAAVAEVERLTPLAPHWKLKDYKECLRASEGKLLRWAWVAESGAGILGFAVVRGVAVGEELECELESLVVRPEAQRRGIGSALLGMVISTMKANGARLLTLEVRASNVPAMRLYERHGMTRVGIRPCYYAGPPEDAVVMQLEF